MASLAIDGLVLGVTLLLSAVPLKDTIFPPAPADQITNIQVCAGSLGTEDGNVPGIHLFDLVGETIGYTKASGDVIEQGQQKTIQVNHRLANKNAAAQAEYISVTQGGNDAICISWISATLEGGTQYSFAGDIGWQCGAFWNYGNTTISADGDNGIFQPRCMWIDGDDTNNITTKGFGVHLPSFLSNQARADQYQSHNDIMCKSDPRFKLYDKLDVMDPIPHFINQVFDMSTLLDNDFTSALDPKNWATEPVDTSPLKGLGNSKRATGNNGNAGNAGNNGNTGNTGKTGNTGNTGKTGNAASQNTHPGGRVAPPQSAKHQSVLVKSRSVNHSANQLCGSSTSWGPDFVSLHENVFCDMAQKTTWPLCNKSTDSDCFDQAKNTLRMKAATGSRPAAQGKVPPVKKYTHVKEW